VWTPAVRRTRSPIKRIVHITEWRADTNFLTVQTYKALPKMSSTFHNRFHLTKEVLKILHHQIIPPDALDFHAAKVLVWTHSILSGFDLYFNVPAAWTKHGHNIPDALVAFGKAPAGDSNLVVPPGEMLVDFKPLEDLAGRLVSAVQ